ncbi:MAG TPA: hypothetical protein VML01_13385, partial [Bryobacterales bacterium]|nr:hypothetical protein [Bryobacterales bacterium]
CSIVESTKGVENGSAAVQIEKSENGAYLTDFMVFLSRFEIVSRTLVSRPQAEDGTRGAAGRVQDQIG